MALDYDFEIYRLRSVRPDGLVVHECGTGAADLTQARADAQQLARSVIAAGPTGKSWEGWCVDVLNERGQWMLRIPFSPDLLRGQGKTVKDS